MKKSAGASSKLKNRRVAAIASLRLVPLVAILWMVAPTYAAPVTDPASGHTYEVISVAKTWADARSAAAGMGTASRFCHLATITSQAENTFVAALLGGTSDVEFWLGGEQKDPDPQSCQAGDNDPSLWGTWVTGESWSYTNWFQADAEPDDCNEACLTINETGVWENEDCNTTNEVSAYVVECEPHPSATDQTSGHAYTLIHLGKTWPDARAAAQAMSTAERSCHLATITSQAENDFVVDRLIKYLGTVNGDDLDAWIGGEQRDRLDCQDEENNASYWGKWVTGELWSYTNWAPGDPSECPRACLTYAGAGDQWEGEDCSTDTEVSSYLVECELKRAAPVLSISVLILLSVLLIVTGSWALRRRRRSAG